MAKKRNPSESDAAWERIEQHIPESISEHRLSRGFTQRQMEDLTRLDQGSISNFERGRRRPNLQSIWRLCNALEISASDLLGF